MANRTPSGSAPLKASRHSLPLLYLQSDSGSTDLQAIEDSMRFHIFWGVLLFSLFCPSSVVAGLEPESCSVCHLPRFMEWNASEHAHAKIKCETCHDEGHSADVLKARQCEHCHTSDLVFLAQKANFALWEPHNLVLTEQAQSMKQIGFRLIGISVLLLAVYGVFRKYSKRKSEV